MGYNGKNFSEVTSMPSAYAHLRFGWEMTPPGKYAVLSKNFPQLYNVGLQGPDLLFYHNPLVSTAVTKLGYSLHSLSGQTFFGNALEAFRKAPSDGAKAYLFGLLGHYCLDSRCHPLINQLTAQGQPGHMELETEFDRYLQQLDGKVLPQDRHVGQYLRLTRGEQATVSGFYNEVSPGAIGWCSGNMARVYRIITSRRRKTARFLLSLGGEKAKGLLPTVGPNPSCAYLNGSLFTCYRMAAEDYPVLAEQLVRALEENSPLGEEFAPIFG